jgi:alpha-amylase
VDDTISLALVLHNHQPVGNFGWVIADAYERAYQPMIEALERHPAIRLALHYSGPLLDWIRAERPDFLERVVALARRGQVELVGGGYYEPVLASLPERDRVDQLARMADEIARLAGRRPTGAWLAERVWEPDLPTSLVDAGYRWTVVDDTHFRAASVDGDALWGAYTTEDQGRLLAVFGSDKALRYGVPFGSVDQVIARLVGAATPAGDRLAVMGDDGEKFGSWPDTFAHCWAADGWVERFFAAIEAEPAIATVTPSDWLTHRAPIGRVYLPTGSYFEMGEWALPADEGVAFEAAVRTAEAEGAPWRRWLRGGFWRNFQVKYREVNDLHKQMLRVSAMVAGMPVGPDRDLARDHLHQGQSNDCYWHGVFGGVYLPHMRLATLGHLIAAEDLADLAARRAGETPDRAVLRDTDLDGTDEVLVTTPGQVTVIDPAEGGALGTWDIRAVRHALTAVMRRRPEAYHARLLGAEAPDAATHGEAAIRADATITAASATHAGADRVTGGGDRGPETAAATIHELVRSREPGLAARLRYDAYERRSGLVRLLAPGTTAAAFADGAAVELGGAVDGAYEVTALADDEVSLRRDVALEGALAPIRVDKRFVLGGDRSRPTLDLEVGIENRSAAAVRFDLGLEWALTMLGGGANPAAYYRIGEERLAHDSSGERSGLSRIVSGNVDVGIELVTTIDPPATAWWSPIETISNSEGGFERVYQGSALVFVWPTALAPGEARVLTVRHAIETPTDRTADELAAPDPPG